MCKPPIAHLHDSALAAHETDLERLLVPFVKSDVLVLAPWIHDWHPDHEACGRAARRVCEQTGPDLIYYLFWTWHRRNRKDLEGIEVLRFDLSADLLAVKQTALACHRSQLAWATVPPILSDILLAPTQRPFESFIPHV